jgi:hypothetical protein
LKFTQTIWGATIDIGFDKCNVEKAIVTVDKFEDEKFGDERIFIFRASSVILCGEFMTQKNKTT